MVLTGLFPGGAEKIALELTRFLLKQGQEVAVVSLLREPSGPDRAIVDAFGQLGVRIFFLNLTKKTPYRIFSLLGVIRREKPDIVHSHLMHANLCTRFARLFRNFRLVNTIHIAEKRPGTGYFFRLDRLTFFLCDAYTAVSEAAARFHEKRCGFPEGTIQVIYNGSDPVTPASGELVSRVKREWGIADADKVIGSIGRLDFQKGYDRLLERLPRIVPLIPKGRQWALVVIGNGPEKDSLRLTANALNQKYPELRVVFPGYRPDASSLMAMFDLFVMPSRYEGFGLALTEALSLGLPVLCSNADSLPELCAHARESSLVVDFDAPAEEFETIFERALRLPHSEKIVIQSCEGMTNRYFRLYKELTMSKKNKNIFFDEEK